ncbi:MAG: amidohydrolase [Anaerolineales bacterium]|nr:amidohydrolase [Anaerolineales bacterium]
MGTILIKNGAIVTVNDQQQVFSKGYVFIEQDRIAAVGPGQPPAPYSNADTVLDASLMAVMPGMVNGHTHLFQTFLRGLADDKPLLDWLKTAIWPVAKAMTKEDAYVAALLGLIENIRGGATTVVDHQYIHTETSNDDGICRAADEVGLRFKLARGWADQDYHPSLMETPDRIISETTRLYETWQLQGNGRTRVEFGPLIPWGCTDKTMLETWHLSQGWGAGTHIHVAETQEEIDMNIKTRGKRHIEWLSELGVLGPDFQLVHSVWLEDHEIDMIAEKNAVVVHCPVSNMYLASGAARIAEMHRRGIRVALATDGPGSNNNQDMFEVLKATALLQKVSTLDAMALLPEDVIWMACRGGAASYGLPENIGSLEPGRKADVVLVDLNTPLAMPVHRVPSALVYNVSAGDVDTMIVDGRILMQHKEILVLDERALLDRARRTCADLFGRAGVVID